MIVGKLISNSVPVGFVPVTNNFQQAWHEMMYMCSDKADRMLVEHKFRRWLAQMPVDLRTFLGITIESNFRMPQPPSHRQDPVARTSLRGRATGHGRGPVSGRGRGRPLPGTSAPVTANPGRSTGSHQLSLSGSGREMNTQADPLVETLAELKKLLVVMNDRLPAATSSTVVSPPFLANPGPSGQPSPQGAPGRLEPSPPEARAQPMETSPSEAQLSTLESVDYDLDKLLLELEEDSTDL